MVYCSKCGYKNPDDAKVCAQCGTPLYPPPPQESRQYRRDEQECFGIPRGGTVATLVFGAIIVLMGLSFLISDIYHISIPWWPLIIVVFGSLMILGGLYQLTRR